MISYNEPQLIKDFINEMAFTLNIKIINAIIFISSCNIIINDFRNNHYELDLTVSLLPSFSLPLPLPE